MNILKFKHLVFLVLITIVTGCSSDAENEIVQSDSKAILSFVFAAEDNAGLSEAITTNINENDKTITAVVPFDTDVSALQPTIATSALATISSTVVEDFSNPVNYTVTAEDGSTAEYITTISVEELESIPFVTVWETTEVNENITIYTNPEVTGYDYQINWGDGTVESNLTEDATHEYANAGVYTVEISNDFPAIIVANDNESGEIDATNANKLQSIESWGNLQWESMESAFGSCSNLTYNATDAPNLDNVTSLKDMFRNAIVFNGNLSDWDVSNITNMREMFVAASSFRGDLSDWDVGNVTNMNGMFQLATSFNGDISEWNVSNVNSMFIMFSEATSFNGNLNDWDVSNVTDMGIMFQEATSFNGAISEWDLSNVTDMIGMFQGATSFNGDVSNWNVSSVTSMTLMFDGASVFNQDLSGWATDNVIFCSDFSLNSALATENLPIAGACFGG